MAFEKLQWLFPVAVTLHNAEEAIWMPGWAAQSGVRLPFYPSAEKIWIALLVLTLAAFVVTHLSVRRGPNSLWAYVTFGYIATMLANVFIPHVPAMLFFGRYAPGVVTAVIVNLAVMSYLAIRAIRECWVGGWKAVAFGAGVPVLLAGSVCVYFAA